MLYFPQLSTGATGQYPVSKRSVQRTIVSQLPDGHAVKLADPGADYVEWQLAFQGLSDAELNTLEQFHAACEGQLNSFVFLDPVGNLLAWSEQLTQAAWQASTLLEITAGIDDPNGGSSATRITNQAAADLALQQDINAPGWYCYCFSVYARGQGGSISLLRAAGSVSASESCALPPKWTRLTSGGALNTTAESFSAGILIPAGQSVDVFGFQLEAQPGASPYKPTLSGGGVYATAHFSQDAFAFTTTAPNRHSCTLTINAH